MNPKASTFKNRNLKIFIQNIYTEHDSRIKFASAAVLLTRIKFTIRRLSKNVFINVMLQKCVGGATKVFSLTATWKH